MRTVALSAASLALGAAAAVFLLARSEPRAAAAPGDQKVGVVDIAELLRTAPGKAAIEEAYKKRKDELNLWGKAESDRIKAMQSALENTARAADPQRAQKEKDVEKAMIDFKFEGEYRTRQNEIRYTDDMEGLYEQIKSAVRDVATQNGLTLVVVKNDERVEATRLSDFMTNVMVHPVMYYERSLDITQAVRDRLGQTTRPPTPATGAPPPSVPPPGPVRPGGVPPSVPPAGGQPGMNDPGM